MITRRQVRRLLLPNSVGFLANHLIEEAGVIGIGFATVARSTQTRNIGIGAKVPEVKSKMLMIAIGGERNRVVLRRPRLPAKEVALCCSSAKRQND